MALVNDSNDRDPVYFSADSSAQRYGRRIREIREARGLSQSELGALIGLNADRVQKYENGARRPKLDLIEKIADALGVSVKAIVDPVVSVELGAMFALFEMESVYGTTLEKNGSQITIKFDDQNLNNDIKLWFEEKNKIAESVKAATAEDEKAELEKDYKFWKWNFPPVWNEPNNINLKKSRIQEKIDQLKQELAELEEKEK